MEKFEESTAGHLLTLAVITPLVAGAGVTWDDGGAGSIIIMGSIAVGTMLATVGAVAALERRAQYSIAAALAFPPALLLYFQLLALGSQCPEVRLVMGFAALGMAGFLMRDSLLPTQRRATSPARPATQH